MEISAALDLVGCPTLATPFDGRFDPETMHLYTEVWDGGSGLGLNDLFWEARRFVYVKDGDGDDWQSPWLTEMKQAGDCEDKALWLYTRLRAQGYDNVRLVIGHYRAMDKDYHVWIMHRDGEGITRILDPTLQNRVWKLEQFGAVEAAVPPLASRPNLSGKGR